MSKPPYYLALSYYSNNQNPLNINEEVGKEEFLYHRIEDKEYPYREYLSQISSTRLNENKGLSVNRSKYSKYASDVLWIGEMYESYECRYKFKSGFKVICCQVNDLDHINENFAVTILCKYDPLECNIAHANLISSQPLNDVLNKSARRDFWLKLASIFVMV